jgi:hypothetical protein
MRLLRAPIPETRSEAVQRHAPWQEPLQRHWGDWALPVTAREDEDVMTAMICAGSQDFDGPR